MDERPPAGPSDATDVATDVVRSLHALFQSVDDYSRAALRRLGVSGPQIWALGVIGKRGGLTMGELAAEMHLHISTVSGIADRLEAGGFARRERAGSDRRVVHLRLTPRGRKTFRLAPPPPRQRIQDGMRRLSLQDLRALRRSTRLLQRFLQRDAWAKGRETAPRRAGTG